jgi:hypothetical protein
VNAGAVRAVSPAQAVTTSSVDNKPLQGPKKLAHGVSHEPRQGRKKLAHGVSHEPRQGRKKLAHGVSHKPLQERKKLAHGVSHGNVRQATDQPRRGGRDGISIRYTTPPRAQIHKHQARVSGSR